MQGSGALTMPNIENDKSGWINERSKNQKQVVPEMSELLTELPCGPGHNELRLDASVKDVEFESPCD
jgi:hypothetical protein